MTLFHLHDDFAAPAGENRVTLARVASWLAPTLGMIHESIVAARTRRPRREPMFHEDSSDEPLGEADIGAIPQRPMILGDKWDF